MFAILIPAQDLFCKVPLESDDIDEFDDRPEIIFQSDFFTLELTVLLERAYADWSPEISIENLDEFRVELFILTEHDPNKPFRQSYYTLRHMYGERSTVACGDELFRRLRHHFKKLNDKPLNFTLSADLALGTGAWAPLERQWDHPRFSRRILFTRWNYALNNENCKALGVELNRLESSFISKFCLDQALALFHRKNNQPDISQDGPKQAYLLIDTDETLLNNHDSRLFMRAVLNSQVIEIIKLFQTLLLSNQFVLRCLVLTARNPQDEKRTWEIQPQPVTTLPGIVKAAVEQGLALEFDEKISFSNAKAPVDATKYLKLEHVKDLVQEGKLPAPPGSLFCLIDDCPMELHSARSKRAASNLNDRQCTVLTVPVSRLGYAEPMARLSSLFQHKPSPAIDVLNKKSEITLPFNFSL